MFVWLSPDSAEDSVSRWQPSVSGVRCVHVIPFSFRVLQVAKPGFSKPGSQLIPLSEIGIWCLHAQKGTVANDILISTCTQSMREKEDRCRRRRRWIFEKNIIRIMYKLWAAPPRVLLYFLATKHPTNIHLDAQTWHHRIWQKPEPCFSFKL